jgi:hypothetical protein
MTPARQALSHPQQRSAARLVAAMVGKPVPVTRWSLGTPDSDGANGHSRSAGETPCNTHEAKTLLSQLVAAALAGEDRQHDLIPPLSGLDAGLLCAAADLPLLHRDPFDRLLIGTAIQEHLAILTPDHLIRQYPEVFSLW